MSESGVLTRAVHKLRTRFPGQSTMRHGMDQAVLHKYRPAVHPLAGSVADIIHYITATMENVVIGHVLILI